MMATDLVVSASAQVSGAVKPAAHVPLGILATQAASSALTKLIAMATRYLSPTMETGPVANAPARAALLVQTVADVPLAM
jgi:hypothetical protein